jgi:hypothetical protein
VILTDISRKDFGWFSDYSGKSSLREKTQELTEYIIMDKESLIYFISCVETLEVPRF